MKIVYSGNNPALKGHVFPSGISYYFSEINEHGNPVERTKNEYPYSYDGFVTWRGGENKEANETIYSDRLLRQNYEKTRKLMKKHFGNEGDYYSGRTPEKIEMFLSEWLGKKVKLIYIMEYCNNSSGYPYWRFEIKK